jgi:hypothetical protein
MPLASNEEEVSEWPKTYSGLRFETSNYLFAEGVTQQTREIQKEYIITLPTNPPTIETITITIFIELNQEPNSHCVKLQCSFTCPDNWFLINERCIQINVYNNN